VDLKAKRLCQPSKSRPAFRRKQKGPLLAIFDMDLYTSHSLKMGEAQKIGRGCAAKPKIQMPRIGMREEPNFWNASD
jgi:hypothetical protein